MMQLPKCERRIWVTSLVVLPRLARLILSSAEEGRGEGRAKDK